MLYLTCTTITSIDLAHYGVSCAKDWVSVKCGTSCFFFYLRHAVLNRIRLTKHLTHFYFIYLKVPIQFALELPCNSLGILHGVKCILHGVTESHSLELLYLERKKVWQPSGRQQQMQNK